MDAKVCFSKNLRTLMGKKGVSTKDVCNDLDINDATYYAWINGRNVPGIEKLQTLADYFFVEVSDLFAPQKEEAPKMSDSEKKISVQNALLTRCMTLDMKQQEFILKMLDTFVIRA